jgi:hypothetical protein
MDNNGWFISALSLGGGSNKFVSASRTDLGYESILLNPVARRRLLQSSNTFTFMLYTTEWELNVFDSPRRRLREEIDAKTIREINWLNEKWPAAEAERRVAEAARDGAVNALMEERRQRMAAEAEEQRLQRIAWRLREKREEDTENTEAKLCNVF